MELKLPIGTVAMARYIPARHVCEWCEGVRLMRSARTTDHSRAGKKKAPG